MMQSGTFSEMWRSLGAEESFKPNVSFKYNLLGVKKVCFNRILSWMDHWHGSLFFEIFLFRFKGRADPVIEYDNLTCQV